MSKLRFLVYSDIHHDEYKNGLTGADLESIEDQFTVELRARGCDFWIFNGDRFASRNPYDVTRHRADSALLRRQQYGIPGYMLVGNHDQWKKNAQLGHSMLLLNQTISKVQVFDTPDTLLLKGGDLQAYLLPAGFEGDPGFKPPAPSARGKEMHLALYHGMLRGSKYQNGMVSEHGRLADTLNNRAYDLVLCGDNHAHQKLDMLDQTQGWYVGAPCQHNWGDTGAERGFMYFEFDSSTRAVHAEFVPTKHPKFLRLEVQVASNKELLNWALAHKAEFKDNMVRVSVLGKSDDLSTLDTSSAEAAVRRFGARTCEFKPKFDNSAVTISSEEKKTVTDESIWAEYVQTKVDTLEGIDAVLLAELARGYFQ